MSDCQTICRACNRASNGEEYCARCEGEIARKEKADSKRGFALPVVVMDLLIGGKCVGPYGGNALVAINLDGEERARELAEVIADAINEHYSDETEGA